MYTVHLHVLYIVSYEATATKYIIIGLAQLWYFFNYFKNQFKVAEHSFGSLWVQWNPINKATIGPKKFGHINGVTVLTRVFLQENV